MENRRHLVGGGLMCIRFSVVPLMNGTRNLALQFLTGYFSSV
jgi:hypothetical protein